MSINKITGIKKQDSFTPGVDNNNFVRTSEFNKLVDEVTDAIEDAKSEVEETVKPYKSYVALLSQSGTDAPTAIVLENTLSGNVVWTYDSVGNYFGTLSGEFVVDKTFVMIATPDSQSPTSAFRDNANSIGVRTSSDLVTPGNGILNSTAIEIRVYN